jgi:hypothetical protein
VLGLDPFARRLPARERARRATAGFEIASRRLVACATAQGVPLDDAAAGDDLQRLSAEARDLAPRAQAKALSRDLDLLDRVMDLVFRIEEACEARCGPADRADEALVLIARDRRATER